MLHFPEPRAAESGLDFSGRPEAQPSVLDFDRLLAIARRQFWVVVLCAAVGLGLGIAYVLAAVPLYTASTDILIDKNKSRTINELSDATGVLQDDAEILSQVELLKSLSMVGSVVDDLKLTENEQFMAGTPSLLGRGIGAVMSLRAYLPLLLRAPDLAPVDEDARRARAIDILSRNVDVERVGKTYVLTLSYTSPSPGLSAQVAQAFASAYLNDQLEAKYDATRRASNWLQDRITELKTQSYNADLAVQKFRSENNLIAANGQLVSDQQLSEINSQLITAQAATAEAKARHDQIETLIQSGRTDAVVDDALGSSTINKLRDQYLTASQLETQIVGKLGENHIQAVRLRQQMAEYQKQIFDELRRIAESYRNAYDVAYSRQQSLEQNLSSAVDVSATANTTQVQLRELEREADTFKTLYQNFLQRYQETIQQQSFPVTEARVITPAGRPTTPSKPQKPLMLALFGFLGLAAGAGLGALREHRERFLRVGEQVRSELKQEFLGYLPIIQQKRLKALDAEAKHDPVGAGLWPLTSVNAYVRSHPMSGFAESLRNVKVAADLNLADHRSKVIGIVSCLPTEGKSTVASNFALLLAMQGARTLLIDGDLRNPGVTRRLIQRPNAGTLDAIMNADAYQSYLRWDESGTLAVLPTMLRKHVTHSSELLTSPGMTALLAHARTSFDHVVIDLPPLAPVIDAKAFAPRVDGFAFVAEWGRTSRRMVQSTLDSHPGIRSKLLGVLLSKVDTSKMRLYRAYGSSEYYASRYSQYYAEPQ